MTLRRRFFHVLRLLAVTLVLLAGDLHAAYAQLTGSHEQVLVLYATRRDAQFSIVGERELAHILDVGLTRDLDYYSEFIDLSRFPDPSYKEAFGNFLALKYANVRFDLVIAMHDAAIEFLAGNRNGIFRNTPAVFLTTDRSTARLENSTGLIQERDFAGTVGLIQRLQPDVQRIFVVTGAARADRAYATEFRRQYDAAHPRIPAVYLSGLATEALEQRLATLPPRSAVYYVLVTADATGMRPHPLEYVDRVAAAANAPTYSWVDSTMGHGVVGGSLYSQEDVIGRVGALALRVLNGEPADNIPLETLDLNTNQVDWRQLRRWGLSEARVPAGTVVRFREPTIWDRYKFYILATVALLVTQSGLISALLLQRHRRQRAEGELVTSQQELRRSYERIRDLGARLLKAQDTERSRIARELHDDVCQRLLLLTIELDSLRRSDDREGPAESAFTVAQDISKSLHELSHQLHPTRLRMIGLDTALERLCEELSKAGIAIHYRHDNVPSSLTPDVMLCVFRVVQEALHNAVKHSHASEISVVVSGDAAGLALSVVDNGAGFDVDSAWTKGVGLASMAERLETLGGTLVITSTPGAGTCVSATVALQSEYA